MRGQHPSCTIKWDDRVFCLPVTVPPHTLTPPEKVLEYLAVLDVTATNLINTFDRFQVSGAPGPQEFRSAPKAAAAGSNLTVLPRITGNVSVSDEFNVPLSATDGGASSVVTKKGTPFNSPAPEPGDQAQVEAQLQTKLNRDEHAYQFSRLPVPTCGVDTIRFFFGNRTSTGFTGALGLNDQGIILANGSLAATLPNLLLDTRDDDGT